MKVSVLTEKTPVQITAEIERFCEEVAPGQKPVYVPVKPEKEAEVSRCHVNVEHHVKAHGGTPMYGWIIWQSPALLHAEFHCNWLSSNGKLSDITPKVDGETQILFLPDQIVKWNGRVVPSRRKARRQSPAIDRFVATYEQMDKIGAKYLAGQPYSSVDQERYLKLMMESAIGALAISNSWTTNTGEKARLATDRQRKKKAARQRRKKQRRRGK